MSTDASEPALRVLIVEDDPIMSMLVAELVTSLGGEVVGEADSDMEATRSYGVLKPDLTFLDINLGTSDGLGVLKHIMDIDRDAKVVMLTGLHNDAFAQHCIELGAQGYIVKGDGTDDIRDSIVEQMALCRT